LRSRRYGKWGQVNTRFNFLATAAGFVLMLVALANSFGGIVN